MFLSEFTSILLFPTFILVLILFIKIHLLQKSIQEIEQGFAEKLEYDTNTLLTVSSRDRHILRLADSINTQLRKLQEERHRYQQGDLEIKDTITNISHDLRTPLTAICGYLDLLEKEALTENSNRYLAVIKDRTRTLTQLTEELFYYSIAASGLQNRISEEVILNYVLEESISAYYAAFMERNISPEISISEKKIKRILDKKALSRIFENILSNVIKYSDGDIVITLRENGEILFSNHASNLNLIEAEKLFHRFYTVETAEKSTGLGLSIAKMLTEQMGGTISAHYSDSVLKLCLYFRE